MNGEKKRQKRIVLFYDDGHDGGDWFVSDVRENIKINIINAYGRQRAETK